MPWISMSGSRFKKFVAGPWKAGTGWALYGIDPEN